MSVIILSQGYRSLMGISVVQSCETALYYYQKAAKKGTSNLTPYTLLWSPQRG